MSKSKTPSNRPFRLHKNLFCLIAVAATLAISGFQCSSGGPPVPRSGVRAYEDGQLVQFPHGIAVNVVGGNLMASRTDLSIDTHLGTLPVASVYNSSDGSWRHNFDMNYDGTTFVDDTGAAHNVGALADGEQIAGTSWVKLDSQRIKTLGGQVYEFAGAKLSVVHRTSQAYPRLTYQRQQIAGDEHIVGIDQCVTGPSDCSDVYDMVYDTNGNITEINDRAGRQATFSYASGMLSAAKDGFDVAQGLPGFRYTYSGTQLTSVRNSEDEEVSIDFASGSRPRTVTIEGAQPVSSVFGWGRMITQLSDDDGRRVDYRFDAQRRLTSMRLATGETTLWTWTDPANPFKKTSETDPAGVTTVWSRPDAETLQTLTPGGNTVVTTFAPIASNHERRDNLLFRPVVAVTDSVGAVVTNGYDAQGRLVWTENGEAERTTLQYNAENHISERTSPTGVVTGFAAFNDSGHAQTIVHPLYTEQRTFDAVGNQLTGDNAAQPYDPGRPGIVSRAFDEDRNLTTITMMDSEAFGTLASVDTEMPTHIARRSDGKVLSVSRPFGGDHIMEYDDQGKLTSQSEIVGGVLETTNMEYDHLARLTAIDAPNGMRQEFGYDDANRVSEQRHRRNGALEGFVVYSREDGRLVSKLDPVYGADESYTYDAAGRVSRVDFPNGEAVAVAHDARSRETSQTLLESDGSTLTTLTYRYDLANRRTDVDDGSGSLLSRTFSDSQLSTETFGNGITRTYGYTANTGRLETSQAHTGTGAIRENTTVTQTFSAGLVLLDYLDETTRTWGSASGTTVRQHTVSGSVNILTPSQTGRRLLGEIIGFNYGYDGLGNMSHNPWNLGGVGPQHAYNAERNRVLAAGGRSFTYDNAGFTATRGGVPLTWTAHGRLASHGSDTFTWDAEGRLESKTISGVTKTYRYGGLVEADASGQPLAIDLDFAKLGVNGTETLYRHRDFRGNVKYVTDESADVVLHRGYAGYKQDRLIGSAVDDRGFAGGINIGDGLLIIGARIYDGDASRFLSQDPLFNFINQYQYAEGNPVDLWDSDGRISNSAAGAFLSTAGAGVAALGGTLAAVALGVALSPVAAPAAAGAAIFFGATALGGILFHALGEAILEEEKHKAKAPLVSTASLGGGGGLGVGGSGGARSSLTGMHSSGGFSQTWVTISDVSVGRLGDAVTVDGGV